ncbi:MAG: O-antigen polymerase [uncultured bacterium]|nr:MAG: O-antigen polymerase [uncultured bacterium]
MTIDGTANRIYGTFAHPNILATFSLLLFIFLFHKYQNYLRHDTKILKLIPNWFKESKKDLYPLALFVLITLVTLTYTRIAWIGLTAFIIMIGLYYKRRETIKTIAALAIIYIMFFPINLYLINNFNVNLQDNALIARLTSRNMEADSISWRANLTNKTLPLWLKRPLIGYGYGSFAKVWDDNKGVDNIWDSTSEAHDDYLKVGFEVGIIGLILYIAIFCGLILHSRTNFVFMASVIVYLILSVSDNMLHHTPVIWWWWALWGYWIAKE